jgi:4-diphosphocytidyl-2-C-methyl-D-erythritol kinase
MMYNNKKTRRCKMNAVKENAYAKINLYLDILAKRPDGFHDIETVMHAISLCDEVKVTVSPSRKALVSLEALGGTRLPTDDRNIAVKAAKLYLSRAGISDSVKITLTKNIPVSAGLAGGSTDAAAVLRALNRLYNKRYSNNALLSLASELGSDVPFCLLGGTALCRGRGEDIERLPNVDRLQIVVAISEDEHVSTPTAYSALDALYSDFDGSVEKASEAYSGMLISSIKRFSVDPASLYNIFEEAILPICEGAQHIKARMLELGAKAALMSGSGPSVFGIFETEEAAKSAARDLLSQGFRAYAVTSA